MVKEIDTNGIWENDWDSISVKMTHKLPESHYAEWLPQFLQTSPPPLNLQSLI